MSFVHDVAEVSGSNIIVLQYGVGCLLAVRAEDQVVENKWGDGILLYGDWRAIV
jgi:hypothetical protein